MTNLSLNIYVVLYSGAFSIIPPLHPVFVVCSSSRGVGGVGGGKRSYTIGCRMASSSSESVPVCFGPLLRRMFRCDITRGQTGRDGKNVIS